MTVAVVGEGSQVAVSEEAEISMPQPGYRYSGSPFGIRLLASERCLPQGQAIVAVDITQTKIIQISSLLEEVQLHCERRGNWKARLWQNQQGLHLTSSGAEQQFHHFQWIPGELSPAGAVLKRGQWFPCSAGAKVSDTGLAQYHGHDQYGLYWECTLKGVSLRFRWCEPGKFFMGSPENEPERYDDETLHEVILSKGVWLAETTVTPALWTAVMGENPSEFKGEQHPVESVSWDDAVIFIERINELVPGLQARFPWEAEWEYACRAGTTTPFSFGENITPEQVNYDGRRPYAGGVKGIYREKTVEVRSLPCNDWGFYAMHGNVWEWCADFWQEDLGGESVIDPQGPKEGVDRVMRGGCRWCPPWSGRGDWGIEIEHFTCFRLLAGGAPFSLLAQRKGQKKGQPRR